ncbi:DUF2326 domain-containing protein [Lysinibacillus sp. NPDC093216]|uniref:DUF2326 domain-containing protein n=1 Tax=Lysinibacillus sp. NPDC093216 TaxID=3390576 RepID=UPI003D00F857
MFIKKLKIEDRYKTIRDINFHKGLNLILDETPINFSSETKTTATGNNVGKTTVLKLIDFCLGNDARDIYIDSENNKEIEYVKNFLQMNEVLITLILKEDLEDEDSQELVIQRNFLQRNKKIMKINGENYIGNSGQDFIDKLENLIIGKRGEKKPTLREIIAHSIRYSDQRISNTLKVLSSFNSLPEYEALYLYLFGVDQTSRAPIISKIATEKQYKSRLEKPLDKTALELKLSLIVDEVNKYEKKIKLLNINENYEEDLKLLNEVKYRVTQISSEISRLSLRKNIIVEATDELQKQSASIDLMQLKHIYQQASQNMDNIQKTFEELVEYHNKMIVEKIRFISDEIPEIDSQIQTLESTLESELKVEKELATKVTKGDTFKDIEELIKQSNNAYQKKGEIEKLISQITLVDEVIEELENELKIVDVKQFGEEYQEKIKTQLKKFNKFFAEVANELYGETYAITYEIKEHQKSKRDVYVFYSFNANTSSGKKQGEILCFDLAYIQFADSENIPALHFILNDKKELMHGNQLINLNNFIKDKNIQVIISILSDKVPSELNTDNFIVLKLSQEQKLFKIEDN